MSPEDTTQPVEPLEPADADFLLTNAGRLVTCTGTLGGGRLGVIEDGALAARAGEIVWVGSRSAAGEAVALEPGATLVDADGRAVLPGFVDCHTHLVFAGDRSAEFAARLRGERYTSGGVRTTVAATRAATTAELRALARARLDRFASFGVTTVEAKSGYGLTPDNERRLLEVASTLDHPVRVVPTFMGAHVVPEQFEDDVDEYVNLVTTTMLDACAPLATFADVWCDPGAFTADQGRRILRAAIDRGLKPKVHAEQLAHTGAARMAAAVGAVSADHLEHVTWDDAVALARAGTVAVALPGASLMTGGPFAPARLLLERGVRVALSTDFNPGTSYTENLQLMVPLACVHLKMTPEEAILGITSVAAAALGLDGTVGSLQPGARADLVVLDARSELDLAYHYGVNLAARVFVAGKEVKGFQPVAVPAVRPGRRPRGGARG
ncbi:MAG TPA: imidazolonepropionase [Actinomycetota bacterium]